MRDTTQTIEQIDPKTVRDMAGLSEAEMARLMGMSKYGYTAWENDTRRPGGPAYRLLALIADDCVGTTGRLAALADTEEAAASGDPDTI